MSLIREAKEAASFSPDNLYPNQGASTQATLVRMLESNVGYVDPLEFGSTLSAIGAIGGETPAALALFAKLKNFKTDINNHFATSISEQARELMANETFSSLELDDDTIMSFLDNINSGKLLYGALANHRDALALHKQTGTMPADYAESLKLPKAEIPTGGTRRERLKFKLAGKVAARAFASSLFKDNIVTITSNDNAEHTLQTAAHSTYEVQLLLDDILTIGAAQSLASLLGTSIDKKNNLRKTVTDYLQQTLQAIDKTQAPEARLMKNRAATEIVWQKVDRLLGKVRPTNDQEALAFDLLQTLTGERRTWQQHTQARELHFATVIDEERVHRLQNFGQYMLESALDADEAARLVATQEVNEPVLVLEKPQLDPELISLYEQALAEHAALLAPYQTSSNQLKRYGLGNFNKALRLRISDEQAKRVGSMTKSLQEQLGDNAVTALKEKLEITLQAEAALVEQLNNYIAAIKAVDRTKSFNTINRLSTEISWMQDNWSLVENLVNEHWPNNKTVFIQQLRELLDIDTPALDFAIEPTSLPKDEPVNLRSLEELPPAQPLTLDEQLMNRAELLDIVIFPDSDDRVEAIMKDIKDHASTEQMAEVEEWRIRLLDEIACERGGHFYRTKPKGFGGELPWYVAHFEVPEAGTSVAIVENPLYGNATYVIRDEYADFWKELVTLFNRQEAQQLQARQVIHPEREILGRLRAHKLSIQHKITDSLIVKKS